MNSYSFGEVQSNINYICFDDCIDSGLIYTGADPKVPIIYNNEYWFLKTQRTYNNILLNNHLSEYIGSGIFNLFNIEAQKCLLGTYNGKVVVAIRDFVANNVGVSLREFSNTHESSFDSSIDLSLVGGCYTYESVLECIRHYKNQLSIDELENYFWNIFIVDAVLGNFDRHGHNWGLLKKGKETLNVAPVYDNGACLFSRLDDVAISNILQNKEELFKRVYKVPSSKLLLNEKKVTYDAILKSKQYPMLDKALINFIQRVQSNNSLNTIFIFIDNTPFCSDERKLFYKVIIYLRYYCLIESYDFDIVYFKVREMFL